jgi:hypothetical protein
MDQREIFAEFGGALGADSGEAWRVGLDALDARDREANGVPASDGDGGMLGRVLIYTAIIAVLALALWRHS